ncbi:hypothetical protein [Amycolatopsis samaneae]|uniref:Uncharacterized protein n=1 Tax=Amycolatopsis samaneae TaxID=664691 RepID=A0ABW5GKE1_9PSEU
MSDPSGPSWWRAPAPRELPALREHLADYLASEPAQLFTTSNVELGRGTLRPSTSDPALSAALLLDDEHRRLSQAQLFYVTADITKAVRHAARNLTDKWDIQPHDLPATTGFMLFAAPMGEYVRDNGKTAYVVAVSWGETQLMASSDSGLWLTFWTATDFSESVRLARAFGASQREAERGARAQNAELTWDNEIYLPWGSVTVTAPDPVESPQVRTVDPTTLAASHTTIDWLRVAHAGWVFCQPNAFTDVTEQHLPKTARRRAERAGHVASPVRVVSVKHRRTRAAKPTTPSGRTVGVRFPVDPFLRRQAYGPGWSLRRWTVVAGHWRGPENAPVRISTKVTLVDTPPDTSTSD